MEHWGRGGKKNTDVNQDVNNFSERGVTTSRT